MDIYRSIVSSVSEYLINLYWDQKYLTIYVTSIYNCEDKRLQIETGI